MTPAEPLIRDVMEIAAHRDSAPSGWRGPRTRAERLSAHRFHLIEAGRHTHTLPADSKMRPERALLSYLHTAGREEARRWLARCKGDIGRRSSVDLAAHLLAPMTVREAPPGGDDLAPRDAPHEVKL